MAGGRRRGRILSEDEKVLWDKVAESVAPLAERPRRRRRAKPAAPTPAEPRVVFARPELPPVRAGILAHQHALVHDRGIGAALVKTQVIDA